VPNKSGAPPEWLDSLAHDWGVDLSRIAVALVAFLYAVGYLIHSATLRNYGIHQLQAFELQYVEVGVTFLVLTLLLTVVPIGCWMAYSSVRGRSGLPHFVIGATGPTVNTYFIFLYTVTAAMLLTNREINAEVVALPRHHVELTLGELGSIYLAVALFGLLALPIAERVAVKSKSSRALFAFVIEPIRFAGPLAGVLLGAVVLRVFPWMDQLLAQGFVFLLAVWGLTGTVAAILYYVRRFSDTRSVYALALLGVTGIVVVLYLCINAYVYGVIRHVPSNRGGNLPVSQSYLSLDTTQSVVSASGSIRQTRVLGPVYVIEETSDYLYITAQTGAAWYVGWPSTAAVSKTRIVDWANDRIGGGGPRGTYAPVVLPF
jgi:hypothetical protein